MVRLDVLLDQPARIREEMLDLATSSAAVSKFVVTLSLISSYYKITRSLVVVMVKLPYLWNVEMLSQIISSTIV